MYITNIQLFSKALSYKLLNYKQLLNILQERIPRNRNTL